MIKGIDTIYENGYLVAQLIEPDSLPVGDGLQTSYVEFGIHKLVCKKAEDMTTGNGTDRTDIINGYNTLAVVFASTLPAGSDYSRTYLVNGYLATVISLIDEVTTGDGYQPTEIINGYNSFIINGVTNLPPNYADVIQWLTGDTEEREGSTYLIDSKGDQLRTVHPAVYTDTGAITQLQFTDLTGLAISSYEGNGTAVISGNNVNITGTEFSSVEFDDGSFYSLEFLDGSTIKGVQSCTVVGTYTTATTLRYKSYRNLSGYNENTGVYTPANPTDPTKDTDGVDLVYYGRARLDVLLDGTQRTEPEAPEIYAMSQNLTTNILFTGETPTAYEEALLEYDQDYVHYMFANITDYPVIVDSVKYGVAQDDREDLADVLIFVDGNEPLLDSEGLPVIDSNANTIYTLKWEVN